MHQIENKSDIFVEHYIGWQKVYTIDRIGNEQDLIVYLAMGFKEPSIGLDYDDMCRYNHHFEKHYFDGYGRDITATTYKRDAWRYYCLHIRGKENMDKSGKSYWWKKYNYHSVFRQTPIPHTGKKKGGSSSRSPRIKHIFSMYNNPEYSGFNRGSKKEKFEELLYNGNYKRERNWKAQSKRSHQWKIKLLHNSSEKE